MRRAADGGGSGQRDAQRPVHRRRRLHPARRHQAAPAMRSCRVRLAAAGVKAGLASGLHSSTRRSSGGALLHAPGILLECRAPPRRFSAADANTGGTGNSISAPVLGEMAAPGTQGRGRRALNRRLKDHWASRDGSRCRGSAAKANCGGFVREGRGRRGEGDAGGMYEAVRDEERKEVGEAPVWFAVVRAL